MRRLPAALALVFLVAAPAAAERRVMIFADVEGVRRSSDVQFEPNTVMYEPQFDSGGGVGGGVNFFFSSRISLELKVAGLASEMRVRRSGPDFVAIVDVGYAQFYPITALLQWHLTDEGSFRPYLGAGAGYVILRNIDKSIIGASAVEFEDPIGLVVNGGVEIPFSERWSLLADARYTPIESESEVRFVGTESVARIHVRPLTVSFGLGYNF